MKYKLALFLQIIIVISQNSALSLKFAEDKVTKPNPNNMNSINLNCSSNCLKCENNQCKECEKGNFAYENGCYMSCPFETFADNYSSSCKKVSEQPVYIKAYTISRCMNSCGKQFSDCSCNPKCKKFGNCCSDYKFCDIVEKNHSTDCNLKTCKYCTKEKRNQICLQCEDNYYYFNNNCYKNCPEKVSKPLEKNKFCYPLLNKDCSEENCEQCVENSSKCKKCMNGHFLHIGQCVKACPINFHADRMNFVCNPKKEFSFFWIFPSSHSCKNKCGGHNFNHDCSCKSTCMRKGNCCDDFEKFCSLEVQQENCILCQNCDKNGDCLKCKENSISIDKKCQCTEGFKYDSEDDECTKEFHRNLPELKPNSNQEKNININKNFTNQLMKSLNQITNLNFEASDLLNHYLNGNVTINSLHGNTDTQITDENNVVMNSHNNDLSNKTNENSFNTISKISNAKDITKKTNFGTISRGNVLDENSFQSKILYSNHLSQNDPNKNHSNSIGKELENLGSQIEKEILNSDNSEDDDDKDENTIYIKNLNKNKKPKPEKKFPKPKPIKNFFTTNKSISGNSKGVNLLNIPIYPYSTEIKYTNYSQIHQVHPKKTKVNYIPKVYNFSAIDDERLKNTNTTPNEKENQKNVTEALIIGENNTVRDNHYVNNLINVYNTYLITDDDNSTDNNFTNGFKESHQVKEYHSDNGNLSFPLVFDNHILNNSLPSSKTFIMVNNKNENSSFSGLLGNLINHHSNHTQYVEIIDTKIIGSNTNNINITANKGSNISNNSNHSNHINQANLIKNTKALNNKKLPILKKIKNYNKSNLNNETNHHKKSKHKNKSKTHNDSNSHNTKSHNESNIDNNSSSHNNSKVHNKSKHHKKFKNYNKSKHNKIFKNHNESNIHKKFMKHNNSKNHNKLNHNHSNQNNSSHLNNEKEEDNLIKQIDNETKYHLKDSNKIKLNEEDESQKVNYNDIKFSLKPKHRVKMNLKLNEENNEKANDSDDLNQDSYLREIDNK